MKEHDNVMLFNKQDLTADYSAYRCIDVHVQKCRYVSICICIIYLYICTCYCVCDVGVSLCMLYSLIKYTVPVCLC